MDFKLCVHPHLNEFKIEHFSRACTIGKVTCLSVSLVCLSVSQTVLPTAQLQAKLCTLFEVPEDAECRLWQRNMTNTYKLLSNTYTNTYELLSKPTQSISGTGLYGGQVGVAWVGPSYYHQCI